MTEPGSSAPTLMEITEALSEERAGLTAALVEAFVERRHGLLLTQEEAGLSPAVSAGCPRARRARARWRRSSGR